MESQPQNSEFRNNPENFYPCKCRKNDESFLCINYCGYKAMQALLFICIIYSRVRCFSYMIAHKSRKPDSYLGHCFQRENRTFYNFDFCEVFMFALLYNLRVYIQIFALVGGTSRRRVSRYKSKYLYIHEYLYNKTLVS